MTSALLLALRDGCVVHAICLRPADRQAPFHLLFYYLLAYLLLPVLHLTVAGHVFRIAALVSDTASFINPALAWYYPTALADPVNSILPAAVELLAAAGLLWFAVRRQKA